LPLFRSLGFLSNAAASGSPNIILGRDSSYEKAHARSSEQFASLQDRLHSILRQNEASFSPLTKLLCSISLWL
jgi:hypothetical protein